MSVMNFLAKFFFFFFFLKKKKKKKKKKYVNHPAPRMRDVDFVSH